MNWLAEWQKVDPMRVAHEFWPHSRFYREQRDVCYSVKNNEETVLVAGNRLGKDFQAGFICLEMAIVAAKLGCTFRIVNTSVKDDHLRVLWGEIARFVQSSKHPLKAEDGGPLIFNHRDIRLAREGKDGYCYLRGMVSERGEGLAGHHADLTMGLGDEASGLDDEVWKQFEKWAKRRLYFGNPRPCSNRFYQDATAGDVASSTPGKTYRKVFWLGAESSPNVRLARAEIKAGKTPSGEELIPGVITWEKLQDARKNWDVVEQVIGLDGRFYAGKELRLYPAERLQAAQERWRALKYKLSTNRVARGIGCDPAEGGDRTAMAAVDEYGLIEVVSRKTPNTAVIQGELMAFMRKHGCWDFPSRVAIDAGGGGKQIADNIRAAGKAVRTVRFGETITLEPQRPKRQFPARLEQKEDRYVYVNRRAEMFFELSLMIDPDADLSGLHITVKGGFALPPADQGDVEKELLRQMELIPKVTYFGEDQWTMWDPEGRIRMLPKQKDPTKPNQPCLEEILKCSPDELDSLVLACWAMNHKASVAMAGSVA